MNVQAPISSIMTKDVLSVKAKDKLKVAQDLFNKHRIHHLPVTEGNAVLGILSLTDLLYFLKGKSEDSYEEVLNEIRLKNYKVEEIMTKGIVQLSSKDSIKAALDIFNVNLFHALPIIDEDKLVGIISTQDIIRALANQKVPS